MLPTAARVLPPLAVAALACLGSAARADLLEGLEDLFKGDKEWEGAIGAVLGYGPAYLASNDYSLGIKPALFLRYGRFSLNTGAGSWWLDDGWRLGATASIDALGRGQGALGDLSFAREHGLTPALL
jgi:hypothetical protein